MRESVLACGPTTPDASGSCGSSQAAEAGRDVRKYQIDEGGDKVSAWDGSKKLVSPPAIQISTSALAMPDASGLESVFARASRVSSSPANWEVPLILAGSLPERTNWLAASGPTSTPVRSCM